MENYFDISKINYLVSFVNDIPCPDFLSSEIMNKISEIAIPLIESHIPSRKVIVALRLTSQLILDSKTTEDRVANVCISIFTFIGSFYTYAPATIVSVLIDMHVNFNVIENANKKGIYNTKILITRVLPNLAYELYLVALLTGSGLPILIILIAKTMQNGLEAYQKYQDANTNYDKFMTFLMIIETFSSAYQAKDMQGVIYTSTLES